MPAPLLDTQLAFPSVESATPDGLVAVGGDLSTERLMAAYEQGIFPWPHEGLPLMWFSPDPRMLLRPAELRVSRSLRARLRRGDFEIRFDTAFERVLRGCASTPRHGQRGTWITPAVMQAYHDLHRRGLAHSVEAWRGGQLVGGLYGVSLGRAFFGESMFSRVTDASKCAFATLVPWLQARDFHFVDCQMETPHLASLGARALPRVEFLRQLRAALREPTLRGRWLADGQARTPLRTSLHPLGNEGLAAVG
ncbi:MAG: leucyl/phenylalanyl-tRNA--protein transferase [Planctomycetota bacterium]|nr:MAG: leucyl/phenylalanyl-tRNA--protein transferase [Planctomycetota bacterium]